MPTGQEGHTTTSTTAHRHHHLWQVELSLPKDNHADHATPPRSDRRPLKVEPAPTGRPGYTQPQAQHTRASGPTPVTGQSPQKHDPRAHRSGHRVRNSTYPCPVATQWAQTNDKKPLRKNCPHKPQNQLPITPPVPTFRPTPWLGDANPFPLLPSTSGEGLHQGLPTAHLWPSSLRNARPPGSLFDTGRTHLPATTDTSHNPPQCARRNFPTICQPEESPSTLPLCQCNGRAGTTCSTLNPGNALRAPPLRRPSTVDNARGIAVPTWPVNPKFSPANLGNVPTPTPGSGNSRPYRHATGQTIPQVPKPATPANAQLNPMHSYGPDHKRCPQNQTQTGP